MERQSRRADPGADSSPARSGPVDKGPRRRQGTALDRLLATAFVAFFVYLLYLAMTSQLDDKVNLLASWLRRLFT
jgi:hypothetical protein